MCHHLTKVTLCMAALALSAQALTVTFDDYVGANATAAELTSGGAVFTGNFYIVADPNASPYDQAGGLVSTGSTYIIAQSNNGGGGVTMRLAGTGTDGQPKTFGLTSVVLSRVALNVTGAAAIGLVNPIAVNMVGVLASGATVSASVRFEGLGSTKTFTFPPEFVGLKSVRFTSNVGGTVGAGATEDASIGIENIVYTLPDPCVFTLDGGGQAFSYAGGTGRIQVKASNPDCEWTATLPQFVSGPDAGIGDGTFTYDVGFNKGDQRKGTIVIAGLPFAVEQGSAALPNGVGDFAYFATGGGWKTRFTLLNLGAGENLLRVRFTGNDGGSLQLPLTFPQTNTPIAGPLWAEALDRVFVPNQQLIWDVAGSATSPLTTGSAHAFSSGDYNGFLTFTNESLGWSSLVPLDKDFATSATLLFDNTDQIRTGVALAVTSAPIGQGALSANLSSKAVSNPVTVPVTCLILDANGEQIGSETITINVDGHTTFMLDDRFPVIVGKRGTIRFSVPDGFRLTLAGLRGNGRALTTLPVLRSFDKGGVQITHVGSNPGLTTSFYFHNPGPTSATFALNFFDESGGPLQMPVSVPQRGFSATTNQLVQTIPAGGMLLVETRSLDSSTDLSGSAQLVSGGAIGGFEIFRWTTFGQEAAVPFESRNKGSFILVFDNTEGQSTGVAVSVPSNNSADIPVTIRDDSGNILRTATITLPGHGHASFQLSAAYPETAGKRGFVEFGVPLAEKVNVIGLRAKADGTLSTIPTLTR